MDVASMQCHGCGSTNVSFDPQHRMLICNQCGKQEYYSRATLSANSKVLYAKQNAIGFFTEGHYDTARNYAQDVLNIFVDSAPALYILAYFDEFVQGHNGALHQYFQKMKSIALEYEEVKDLMTLYLASPYKLMDFEADVITTIAVNFQSEKDAQALCDFIDKLCPYLISKWPSMNYLSKEIVDIYQELADHCGIPKTCFALINAIQKNPDSPYASNTFFLKPKCRYFFEHFVRPISDVIQVMNAPELKDKFIAAYNQRVQQYKKDTAIDA